MSDVTGFLASNGLTILTKLVSGISAHKNDLVPTGRVFLSLAIVMTLMNAMYQWWIKGGAQEMVASLVRLLIITSIPLFLLSGNNWETSTGYLITAFQSELPSAVGANGSDANSNVSNALQAIANAAASNSYKDANGNIVNPDVVKTSGPDDTSWTDALLKLISLSFWIGLIINFLVFVLNMILFFAIIFSLYMPVAAMAVGVVIGPILIAWLPFEKFAGWTTRWLDYMIANGLSFVVAIVIATGISSAIIEVVTTLQTTLHSANLNISSAIDVASSYTGTILAIFAIYIFAISLLLKANEMASGMTGGSAIGEGLFGNLMAAAAAGAVIKGAKLTGKAHAGAIKGGANLSAKGTGKALEAGSKVTKNAALTAGIQGNGKTGMALANASNAMSGAVNVAKAADAKVQNASTTIANSAVGKTVQAAANAVAKTDGHIANHLGIGSNRIIDLDE